MHLVYVLFEPNPLGLLLEDSVPDTIRMLHPCLGLSDPTEQAAAFAAARVFAAPLDATQMATIRQLAVAAVAHKGPCRWNPSEPLALAAVGGQ